MIDIFKLPMHQSQFDALGYVLIYAVLESVVEEIKSYVEPYISGIGSNFYYSLIANDFEHNKRIREKIAGCLAPLYGDFLIDYKSLNESFLTKPAHTTSELLLHQDWCYTNEERFPSLTLWVPLCDVDENNGAIFLLPGSQKWFNNLRSFSLPTARISTLPFSESEIHAVSMKKGQALFFHPAVFHGSYPNNSNLHRTAVTSVILPLPANYTYFQSINGEQKRMIREFKLDEDVFLRELKEMANGIDPKAEIVKEFHYNHPVITSADLLAKAHLYGK